MPKGGWIGVDLDGTLAYYPPKGEDLIGPPIPAMVDRVNQWLLEGRHVKIITARVAASNGLMEMAMQARTIEAWCIQHLGCKLQMTASKDYAMIQLWDDRCVQVEMNTGRTMIDAQDEVYRENIDEKEREIEQLRATVAAQEKALLGNVLEEHEVCYRMHWINDRIEIEKQIALFPLSKREALDRFVAGAAQMTVQELDAIIGAFGDPEGTYVQRFHAGRAAMKRWIAERDPPVVAPQPDEQEMVEQLRCAGFRVGWDDERDMPIRDAD
jgi:hypothetical protein